MDYSQKHSEVKKHANYHSIYMALWKGQNSRGHSLINCYHGLREKEKNRQKMSIQELLEVTNIILCGL